MKNQIFVLTIAVGLAVVATGCSEKTDASSQLDKAARELGATPVPQTQTAPQPTAPAPAAAATEPPAAPAQEMSQAMIAYKAGNLEDAVTRLQRLRATPVMTPEQRIALNDAMAAVMTEIYGLAAKGDSRAQMAVKQYEKMQTGGR